MKTQTAKQLRYPKPNIQATPKSLTPINPNSVGGLITKALTKAAPNANKLQLFRQLAIDTETTGVDFWHGCKPFFVSTCDEEGNLRFWEWDVHPFTRDVIVPPTEAKELTRLIGQHHFILHNTKFDVRALESIGLPRINLQTCQDTLLASHCLCSNESHKLKDLALYYLNINDDDQQALKEATQEARTIARSLGWAIARDGGHPHFPAQRNAPKEGWWVFDTWLPRAVAREEGYETEHPWWSVLSTYALRDVERTYGLWWLQQEAMEKEGLLEVYEERRKLLEPLYQMEHDGVTVSKRSLTVLERQLTKESNDMHDRCLQIADYKISNLSSSKQIEGLLFGNFKIRPGKMTQGALDGKTTGQQYSTSNEVLTKLLDRTVGEHREFVWKLLGHRGREKSKDYLEEYCLRGRPAGAGWLTLHTSINPTGTNTVRFSSSGPNIQNVGKGGKRADDPVPSLRSIFGPKPGREWFSIDYSNIEMRIFAYKSGDPQLITAFESGYSVHLIFAEILYPEQWAICRAKAFASFVADKSLPFGRARYKRAYEVKDPTHLEILRRKAGSIFKSDYETTYYQWVKNGNFALIYGAGRDRADTTYHCSGAYDLIRKHLPLIDHFMKEKDHEARIYGYITIDPGYRLFIPPTEPHVAVNYFVQGSAGWCMVLAINRVYAYLKSLNRDTKKDYKMIMTIHDELDFDFPIPRERIADTYDPTTDRNIRYIRKIGQIMTDCGASIGVPTPVEIERHVKNWNLVTEKIAV